jgi:hypothetical protein
LTAPLSITTVPDAEGIIFLRKQFVGNSQIFVLRLKGFILIPAIGKLHAWDGYQCVGEASAMFPCAYSRK